MLNIDKHTIRKYDVQGPRYTSYPTAPEWSADVSADTYREKLSHLGQSPKSISLYIHIPFCEQLCYFCACMKVIRTREERHADEYCSYLFKEIDLIVQQLNKRCVIKQLHLGGGTPTFLSESQFDRLYEKISQSFVIDPQAEIAIEVDPRTVTPEKLRALKRLGFNRVSMGVQDFDPEVMDVVNRQQSFDMVKSVTDECRRLGFPSVNFDLIYGLPKQTDESFNQTMRQVIDLRPDRIALYSFAYVPWLQKHQSKLSADDFPSNDVKLDIFLSARAQLLSHGYQAIAMDHFALSNDVMADAFNNKRLYRNFMGYTVKPADEYIGVGVSAISFLENTFIQNVKTLGEYYRCLSENSLPVERGKVLSLDDIIRRWVILEFMCHFQVNKTEFQKKFHQSFDRYFEFEQEHIHQCIQDCFLVNEKEAITVTDLGRLFIRNICMGFDSYLRKDGQQKRYSRTV